MLQYCIYDTCTPRQVTLGINDDYGKKATIVHTRAVAPVKTVHFLWKGNEGVRNGAYDHGLLRRVPGPDVTESWRSLAQQPTAS